MADRKPHSAQATAEAVFSEQTVERMVSDVALARDHAIGRNRRIAQCLCMLGLMRAQGLLPVTARCRVIGAQLQDFSSVAGHEAAHYMPGQLRMHVSGKGDVEPWALLADPHSRDAMATLFSRVQDLPANFNKADSYAEKYASPPLKGVFEAACQQVVNALPLRPGVLNLPAVQSAYQHWIAQSILAYRSAINRKIDIADIDDLPPATAPDGFEPNRLNTDLPELMERAVRKTSKGKPGATVWDYSEQTRILGHYLLASIGSTLTDRLVRDVQAEFKG